MQLSFAVLGLNFVQSSNGQIDVAAYVPHEEFDNVSVIDTGTNTLLGNRISVGAYPYGTAITPDGKSAYVANFSGGTVSVIDTATKTLVGPPIAVGSGARGLAVTPDGGRVYVPNYWINTVSVIDTATNRVIATLIAGEGPEAVTITPNGKYAYIANGLSRTVSVINVATNMVVSTIALPGIFSPETGVFEGVAVTPDGKYVYVTDVDRVPGRLWVIKTAANRVVGSPINVGIVPFGVAVTPDGKHAYCANRNDGTVSVISTKTNTVVGSPVKVGTVPTGVAVTPDGNRIYVTNETDGTISVIETATNRVIDTIAVGSAPTAFGCFIGPNVIVAKGGPLSIANDNALTALGFREFVVFNGGTLRTAGALRTDRRMSLLAQGGTIDTSGSDSLLQGEIINSGSLTKSGAGTLTLTGSNTYSGGTVINAGALEVASPQALGLGYVVVSGGTLKADLRQPFKVNGAYRQGAGGTLALRVGGTAPGQYDVLNVSGHAALEGTLQLVKRNGFQPKVGDEFTLINAVGGMSVRFANVIDQLGYSQDYAIDLLYGQSSLVLKLVPQTPTSSLSNSNRVAEEL